jgi:ATP/maltotriose-dependent transcriptional regulator MalT
MGTEYQVEGARTAFREHRWGDAHRLLSEAPSAQLGGEDLERLATAAYLVGDDEGSIDAWAEAHHRHLDTDPVRAARCAFWAGFQLANRGEMAHAGGWFSRAHRIVEDAGDCAEVGYLLFPSALQALAGGDLTTARDTFTAATELGVRFGEPDLSTLGRLGRGQTLVLSNEVDEGLRLLDEAMVAVTADEVSPTVAGIVYCAVIETCQLTFQVGRAQEWTEALTRWCDRQPDLVPYRGQCLVHRAEVLQLHGAWADALDEASRACARLSDPAPHPALGAAHYQRAELLRLRGDHRQAGEAYVEASRHGRDPQPGLALLRLAEGDAHSAAAAIRRVLSESGERMHRARVLAAATEILLAAGDGQGAATASAELEEIAAAVGAPYLRAVAGEARGAVHLAEGRASEALLHLRRAAECWAEVDAPREAARTRVLLALACREVGDDDTADLELAVAAAVFRELGARPDVERVEHLVSRRRPAPHGLTQREVEVLRLVSGGSTNKEIAGELVLSERTVERHLSNIFTKLGVSTRSAATSFAYENGLV